MSTRYVYSVYNTTADKRTITELTLPVSDEMYPDFVAYGCKAYVSEIAEDRLGNPVVLYSPTRYDSGSAIAIHTYRGDNLKVSEWPYIVISRTAANPTIQNGKYVLESYLLEPSNLSASLWRFRKTSENWEFFNNNYNGVSSGANPDDRFEFYVTGGEMKQGTTLLETVSSRTSLSTGAFDDDGTYKWRVLKGSDNIDPAAVAYSKADLYPGDTVQISVSPRTPAYGGTVYYQYQYTVNGTAWINIGSKTTATSVSLTIPENVEQFQARVLASDGWGFTSTTYVTGPNLGVSQLKAYGTIDGFTKYVKKGYCVMNGAVQDLKKGYVTVNGVWKKLF